MVSWIVDALNSNLRVMAVPSWVGYILASIFDVVSLVLNRSLPFSRRRLAAMLNKTTYSNTKVTSIMGVDCKYGVRKGLLTTINWYRDSGML